jgi:hypothetical protein
VAGAVTIATRLEFVTLDELEAGFADRLGEGAVFLSRNLLGDEPDELEVGAIVHVVVETARGERALAFEGVVSWSYPASPRTPPGREPGAGILIERVSDDETGARVERMRRRPGAGGRVRMPGTRLSAPRIASKLPPLQSQRSTPRLPASLLAPPHADADGPRAETAPAAAPLGDEHRQQQQRDGAIRAAGRDGAPEIVVSHPPAPQPRVMAMGLLVDHSLEASAAPEPPPPTSADALPPMPSLKDAAASASPAEVDPGLHADTDPFVPSRTPGTNPFARAPTTRPLVPTVPSAPLGMAEEADEGDEGDDGEGGDDEDEAFDPLDAPTFDGIVPLALDGLPDAPELGQPAPAFEQRQTDVDLLVSLEDGDFFPAELEEARAKAAAHLAAARSREGAPVVRVPTGPFGKSGEGAAVNPALAEETVHSWAQLEDLPSADADVELLQESNPHGAVAGTTGIHRTLQPSDLDEPTVAPELADESTGEGDDPIARLPSRGSNEGPTAEHTAVVIRPGSAISLDTEHGDAVVYSTAEASASDHGASSLPPRPLPEPEPFPPPPPPATEVMGAAFMVSFKRGGQDPIVSIEPFAWPKRGTKRWSAIDLAREEGEEALDAAVSSSPWLARDPSAPGAVPHSDPGLAEPGNNVVDVVEKAVALAQEEEDSVFSDAPARAPRRRRGSFAEEEGDTIDNKIASPGPVTDPSGKALDETASGATVVHAAGSRPADRDGEVTRGADPLSSDEELETDREMKRPPSQASAETRARLNVLQRFLGRPRE